MVKDITIYTSNTCGQCVMVKKYLQIKGQSYNEVNIEENPSSQNDLMNMTGRTTVPVTVVTKQDGSQDVTIGYNISKLASAIS